MASRGGVLLPGDTHVHVNVKKETRAFYPISSPPMIRWLGMPLVFLASLASDSVLTNTWFTGG